MNDMPVEIADLLRRFGGVVDPRTARLAGLSESRLREAARLGQIYRLGPGAYAATAARELGEWDRFVLRARAFAMTHFPNALLTGWAASVIWHLPTLGRPPGVPTAVRLGGACGGFASARGRMTRGAVPQAHRYKQRTVGLVSKEWATVDLARTAPLPHSLVVADQAVRAHADLAAVLPHMSRRAGIARARWVVEHADPLAETPLETLGRFAFIEYNLPMPVANAWVGHDRPRKRLDGLLPWHWIALEGDGAGKYENQGARVIREQNEREFYLRRLKLDFVRYTWSDVYPGRLPLAEKVRAVIAERPPRDKPVRWWKHVPGGDPVEPNAADWPSPNAMRIVLPAGWDVAL